MERVGREGKPLVRPAGPDYPKGWWEWSCARCAASKAWRDTSSGVARTYQIALRQAGRHYYRHRGRYGS